MEQNMRAPARLSKESQRWWRKIQQEYQITDPGGLLILLTAMESLDRLRDAQAAIETHGACIQDRFGVIKQNPMCNVERDSRTAFYAGLRALNLDLEPLKAIGRPGGS
jgi:P27 family predicted phage terminase small subunit